MAYKTGSQHRVSARSAKSSAVVPVASTAISGYYISGPATSLANVQITEILTTPGGQTFAGVVPGVVLSSQTISSVAYLNSSNQILPGWTAANISGGNILLTGLGMVANSNVALNGIPLSNMVVSQSQLIVTLPANAAGNSTLSLTMPTISNSAPYLIQYAVQPVWQNSNVNLYFTMNNTATNIALTVNTDPGDTITFSNLAPLPIGLLLQSNTTNFGNGTYQGYVSGTINGYPGGYSNVAFGVTATNIHNQATTQAFTANINAPVPLWTVANTFTFTQNGTAITTRVTASISDCVPLTYTLTSGFLPTGLSLNSAGYITGTVTCYSGGYSCIPFTITVNDVEGQSNSRSFSANVLSSNFNMTYVIVGGGGGGGGWASPHPVASGGYGGGGGGVTVGSASVAIGCYTATVGGGGAVTTLTGSPLTASGGGGSSIFGVVACGGGGGANFCAGSTGSSGAPTSHSSGAVATTGYGGGGGAGGTGGAGTSGRGLNPAAGYGAAGGNGGPAYYVPYTNASYAGGGGGGSGTTNPSSGIFFPGVRGSSGGGSAGVGGCGATYYAAPGNYGGGAFPSGPGASLSATAGSGGLVTVLYCSPVQLATGGSISGGPAGPRWYHTFTGTGSFKLNGTFNAIPVWCGPVSTFYYQPNTYSQLQLSGARLGCTAITYSNTTPLPTGFSLSSTGMLTGSATGYPVGAYSCVPFTVRATASTGTYSAHIFTANIAPNTVVYWPLYTTSSNLYLTQNNTPITTQIFANIQYGTIVSYTNTTALPTGLTINSAGYITGYPVGYNGYTNVPFTIQANSNVGTVGTYTFVANINAPVPVWTTSSTLYFAQNNYSYTTQLVATISDNVPLTYANVTALPTGLAINSNGYITGTVAGYSPGYTNVPVTLTVSDVEGQSNTQTFTANISSVPYTINIVAVGAGGGGYPAFRTCSGGGGGGGGGLGYYNSYPVNPANSYTVVVGVVSGGPTTGTSYFVTPSLVSGGGGSNGVNNTGGGGGGHTGQGGGNGGSGGSGSGLYAGGGGGGAGGYSGNGGTGGSGGPANTGSSGSGGSGGAGGGGGGAAGYRSCQPGGTFGGGAGGGGVGVGGPGSNGAGGGGAPCGIFSPAGGGGAGSGGSGGGTGNSNGPGGAGGTYGGGAGGGVFGQSGGGGVVAISYTSPVQIGVGGCVSGGPAGPKWTHLFTSPGTYKA